MSTTRQFFVLREETRSHQSNIRPKREQTDPVVALLDAVFKHQPAVFSRSEPPAYDATATEKPRGILPSAAWIGWNFYRKHYSEPILQEDHYGPRIRPKDFVFSLSSAVVDGNRNALRFLVGEVGSGKTSFLNYCLTNFGQDLVRESRVWFVRYNVHIQHANTDLTVNSLLCGLSEKIRRVLLRLPKQLELGDEQKRGCNVIAESFSKVRTEHSTDRNKHTFVECLKNVQIVLGRRPIIILDNMDAYFHDKDKYLFVKPNDTTEFPQLRDILQIFNDFHHGQSLGDLGATVLFVLRPDTYELLKTSRRVFQGTEDAFSSNRYLYALQPPDWFKVIEMRGELMKAILDSAASGSDKESPLRNALRDLTLSLSQQGPMSRLVNTLRDMTNFGLRDVIQFFGQYTWINEAHDEHVAGRALSHYPIGLIAFLLRNKLLFSEEHSMFPNIYQSTPSVTDEHQFRSLLGESDARTNRPSMVRSHSYWLRRLILSFIDHRASNDIAVSLEDILDVFSEASVKPGYEDLLVRFCVGSLADAHSTNLISVSRRMINKVDLIVPSGLSMTPRGKRCLNSIFDQFFYLQLAVDDPALRLPRLTCLDSSDHA